MSLTAGPSPSSPGIQIVVDPRVELMSVIFRLAGNQEYGQGCIASYVKDVDQYFAEFRNHPAVEAARRLRGSAGISFNAPMGLAVHLKDALTLEERVPLAPRPEELDYRWTPDNAREFIVALRSFVRDTGFKTFLENHRDLYQKAVERLRAVFDGKQVMAWFDGFFGAKPGADFVVALGLLNGGASYGVGVRLQNGAEEIYSILGVWKVDGEGLPIFDKSVAETVVHEFCHSYANPIIDKHKAALSKAAKKIFPFVSAEMKKQAYGNWLTMIYESLVRACGVRFTLAHYGQGAAAQEVKYNRGRWFLWTEGLANLLGEYEKQRDKYPTLDAFFPKIAAFFTEYSRNIETEVAAVKEEKKQQLEALKAKSPKIVSLVPANGASGVDPGLKAIVVTFDRPMKAGSMALMKFRGGNFPKFAGQTSYDATRTVLTIPVELEPGREYLFGLNAEEVLVMKDDQGNPLAPVVIRFKTRK